MAEVLSVNIGRRRAVEYANAGATAIDKRPVSHAVDVRAPGPKGTGGSGVVGDDICDKRHHGGDEQAVYAYAREDLDQWEGDLGRELPCGMFGENLTTRELDVTGARVGERWRIGDTLVLQVTDPRIPCRTFAGWLAENGWVKRFTDRAVPGAYLSVVTPGRVRAGDSIEVVHRPDHDVTIGLVFRALTHDLDLLPSLLVAPDLTPGVRRKARRRTNATP
jgi:MOSC domain-containing protein YiiM